MRHVIVIVNDVRYILSCRLQHSAASVLVVVVVVAVLHQIPFLADHRVQMVLLLRRHHRSSVVATGAVRQQMQALFLVLHLQATQPLFLAQLHLRTDKHHCYLGFQHRRLLHLRRKRNRCSWAIQRHQLALEWWLEVALALPQHLAMLKQRGSRRLTRSSKQLWIKSFKS